AAREKTACELLAEISAGTPNPEPLYSAPDPVLLADEQVTVVQEFLDDPVVTPEELVERLGTAGELTDAQREAVMQFVEQLSTDAEQRRELALQLLTAGPLASEQLACLLEGARAQLRWRQTLGRLSVAAHQVKYPWSGDYSAQGTP